MVSVSVSGLEYFSLDIATPRHHHFKSSVATKRKVLWKVFAVSIIYIAKAFRYHFQVTLYLPL